MSGQYPRNDLVVEFGGVRYPESSIAGDGNVFLSYEGADSPGDSRFTYDEEWDLWEAEIPLEECTSAYSIKSLAKYLGHECQVVGVGEDGVAMLYYLGNSSAHAESDGFEQVDAGTYSKLVPVTQLRNYREEWQDILFEIWRENQFVRPEGTGTR